MTEQLLAEVEVLKKENETLKKENKALMNRCSVFTHGSLCLICPITCDHRTVEFRGGDMYESKVQDV